MALAAVLAFLTADDGLAQQPKAASQHKAPSKGATTAAGNMADFFSQVGNDIYEDCIFELSEEQIEVQRALIEAYIKHGATSADARRLAVKQIAAAQAVREMRADQKSVQALAVGLEDHRQRPRRRLSPRPRPRLRLRSRSSIRS